MGKMLLGLAAGIAAMTAATPAVAGIDQAFVGRPNAKPPVTNVTGGGSFGHGFHSGFGFSHFGDGHFGDGRRDGRRHDDSSLGIWVNGGEWARYNNQTFQSDSYNDWWHDRPDRAYPAWVRNNQNCRPYWAGGGWRC